MYISMTTLLFMAFGLMTVQYMIMQLLAPPTNWLCPAPSNHQQMQEPVTNTRQTHVLILTSTRCGSSFTGQLLNQHPDVFYLFEPLFHVQDSLTGALNYIRKLLVGPNRDLLWSLFQCDLYALENYMHRPPSNHMVTLFFWGVSRALCHTPVCQPRNPDTWTEGNCNQCGPVNLTRASEFCSTRSHVAYKTVRMVVVDDLRPLLEDPRLNIKVIQLVRDPRGILNSRIETFGGWYKAWHTWKTTGQRPKSLDINPPQFNSTCEEFYASVTTALSQPEWLRDRYMLLRYEDLAKNPLQKTKEIFDFVGLNMTSSVEKWISENTRSASDPNDKLSTKKDSASVAESWRRKLPLDMVKQAQSECHHYMRLLGYHQVQTQEELLDMNVSLVQKRTFGPFL